MRRFWAGLAAGLAVAGLTACTVQGRRVAVKSEPPADHIACDEWRGNVDEAAYTADVAIADFQGQLDRGEISQADFDRGVAEERAEVRTAIESFETYCGTY